MQTELIKITGMTCGGCTYNVTKALKDVGGVDDVKVSLTDGLATVQYDEYLTTVEHLKSAIKQAGYGVDVSNTPQQSLGKGCCG